MIFEILAEYVVSGLIDKHRDKLPERMVNLMSADDSLNTLLKKKILPNSLDALKADHPELQKDEGLIEQVIAPAIAYVIYQAVFSGDLSDPDEMQVSFDKLISYDLDLRQKERLNRLLADYLTHFKHELAQHQAPGDIIIMQAMSRLNAEMLNLSNILNSMRQAINDVKAVAEVANKTNTLDSFDIEWFKKQVEASIADAEASRRYLPALNVELPISRLFDSLGRTEEFFDQIFALHRNLRKRHNQLFRWNIPDDELKVALEAVHEQSTDLLEVLNTIQIQPVGLLPFDKLQELCQAVIDTTVEAENSVSALVKKLESTQPKTVNNEHNKPSERAKHRGYELQELQYAARGLWEFVNSKEAILANQPFFLLMGEGGIGKTHLFCEIASQRIRRNLPTILLMGEKFRDDEPWHQIMRQLTLNENHDIDGYLKAFNDFASNNNTRLLILVDALNEGAGVKVWPRYLGSFLHKASQYPHIAIAFSIRSEYEAYVIPDGLIDTGKLIKESHGGFVGLIDRAVRTYFAYYGIEYRVPPLQREFQNPLFLQTLCRGLENRGLTYVPTGLQGFTQIMEFFLSSVNERLAKRLGYNPRRKLVQLAIRNLVEEMASNGSIYISESTAEDIINKHMPNSSNQFTESLYYHLLAEGILTTTIHKDEHSIRFLYDRFTDHLIAQYLLSEFLDPNDPEKAFDLEQPLGKIITHKGNFGFRYSLISAFAIQIPETIGLELFQVAPYMKADHGLVEAMISSLIWREWKDKEIPEALIKFINEEILASKHADDGFLEAILGVAANPDNPFNADFLHRNLIDQQMADRDSWWTIFLHYHYSPTSDEEQTSINRLISWSWSDFDKSSVDPDSIRLMGIALAWFLTSSNRFLRDQATKALVKLFENRITILVQVIEQFQGVNDLYVLERLYAVAYGCAMRSNNQTDIKVLAEHCYVWVFESGTPSPHILLRDYARGVIEMAWVKCNDLAVDVEKIRPPYQSDWIEEPPTVEELKTRYGTYPDEISHEERPMRTIHFSVMGWDFGNYIVSKARDWTSWRFHEEREPSPKARYDAFFELLSPEQLALWEKYEETKASLFGDYTLGIEYILPEWDEESLPEWGDDEINETSTKSNSGDLSGLYDALVSEGKENKVDLPKTDIEDSKANELLIAELDKFLEALTPEQRVAYERDVRAYREDYLALQNAYEKKSHFSLELAQRWIVHHVFELGWTTERFGDFDYFVNYRMAGRESKKAERIGKKYQWLAFHELLARIADNFHYRGDSWDGNSQEYEGTWQTWIRDIDPSFLKVKTHYSSGTHTWWFTEEYDRWSDYETSAQWVAATDDLPDVEPLIDVINTKNGHQWFNLDTMFDWEEPIPPIEDKYEKPRRRLWYMLKSYLVKREDVDTFFEWAQKQDFMGRWMPESHDVHQVYLGEFFWSPAYQHHRKPATGFLDWEQSDRYDMPCSVCVTIDEYRHEDGYDCSIEETVGLKTPSRWMMEKMGLKWRGDEGKYYDQFGNLVCLDPTVSVEGPSTLLVRKDKFMEFLDKNNLEVVWTLLGEKALIGAGTPTEWRKISGAYRLQDGLVVGSCSTIFESRTTN